MKVLVTGATGFLGKHLVRQLLARGTHVRCLVRPTSDLDALRAAGEPDAPGRLEFCQGSLGKAESCQRAVDGCEVVYHLAAEVRGGAAVLFLNNVTATRRLIDAARAAAVRRFVLVSSLAVYGTSQLARGELLDENCPLDPEPHRRDAYTYSKVAQEKVAWEARREHGLPLAVIRPGVIYGPGRDCISGRIGIRVGGLLVRMGGRQRLPYTFVENCADAVRLAGTVPAAEGEAFNVLDDDLPTGRELLKRYRSAVGPARGVTVPGWAVEPLSGLCEWYHRWSQGQLPAVLTRYKSRAMWRPLRYTNAKARAVLGWAPAVDFAEGLRQTFAWLNECRRSPSPVPA